MVPHLENNFQNPPKWQSFRTTKIKGFPGRASQSPGKGQRDFRHSDGLKQRLAISKIGQKGRPARHSVKTADKKIARAVDDRGSKYFPTEPTFPNRLLATPFTLVIARSGIGTRSK